MLPAIVVTLRRSLFCFAAEIMRSFSTKFDEYRDEDSRVIYDVDEERAMQMEADEMSAAAAAESDLDTEAAIKDMFKGANLNRKRHAVITIRGYLPRRNRVSLQVVRRVRLTSPTSSRCCATRAAATFASSASPPPSDTWTSSAWRPAGRRDTSAARPL